MMQSNNRYLLRVEGVNLSNVLDDTSEISIRRSSGLMLREAILKIEKLDTLESISTGASIGLFSIISNKPEDAQKTVVNLLNNNYRDLTFVVDIQAYGNDDFKQTHEKIIAKNRYRQFQQMTLVAPNPVDGATKICNMNHLHPSDNNGTVNKKKHVSASCRYRFDQGRNLRQKFYKQELKQKIKDDFTDNLEELAKPNGQQNYHNLNDKIAVIYLDGNGFGNIQRNCADKEALKAFDECNQDYRKAFLSQLITKVSGDNDMKNAKGVIRLETLLWGGDEMIFVVPAWKGMEIMLFFYAQSKKWHFNNEKLSYAGGIVFSQHNTPISQLIKSAKDLAETVKDSEGGRDAAYFDYLVLESVDYPTQSIEEYWALRYGEQTKKELPPLTPKDFPPDLDTILAELPRGSIYDIGQHWVEHWKHRDHPNNHQLEERIERFKKVDNDAYNLLFDKVFPLLIDQSIPNKLIEIIRTVMSTSDKEKPLLFFIFIILLINLNKAEDQQYKNPAWLHLVELWDYLAPVNGTPNSKTRGQ